VARAAAGELYLTCHDLQETVQELELKASS
jgi:hypothetical protein